MKPILSQRGKHNKGTSRQWQITDELPVVAKIGAQGLLVGKERCRPAPWARRVPCAAACSYSVPAKRHEKVRYENAPASNRITRRPGPERRSTMLYRQRALQNMAKPSHRANQSAPTDRPAGARPTQRAPIGRMRTMAGGRGPVLYPCNYVEPTFPCCAGRLLVLLRPEVYFATSSGELGPGIGCRA